LDNFLLNFSQETLQRVAVNEILSTNSFSSKYGLVLSEKDAKELAVTRQDALASMGRIEFGSGVIGALIKKFCDSPYLQQRDYTTYLSELLETFYYFKNETLDKLSDDELLDYMKEYFDKRCGGSIELLQNRELEKLAHNIRYDVLHYENIDEEPDDELLEEER
jgi:hypothetical protein